MTTQAKPTAPAPPLKLHAAFSGGALELLNTDVDVMGRSLEPVVMLYEGDVSPDTRHVGAGRVLAWDLVTLRQSVAAKIPDVNYAGKIVVNFETFERSLNPVTIDAMGRLLLAVADLRPKASIGWYGHPRRFFWQWSNEASIGEVDGYGLAWMEMRDGPMGTAMTLLAPHNYPIGELVATRAEQLKGPYQYLQSEAERAIGRQTRWVHELARQNRKPVLWFVTPFVCRPGDPPDDYTCNLVSERTFATWVNAMRAGGAEDLAIWLHTTPGDAGQLERARAALVEVVFAAMGV